MANERPLLVQWRQPLYANVPEAKEEGTLPGHNSGGHGHIAKAQIKSIVERVERLEEEKKGLAEDIREVYTEAKSRGFDVKALRAVVRLRRMDAAERAEQEAILDLYLHALGMLADTPLGQAATESFKKGL